MTVDGEQESVENHIEEVALTKKKVAKMIEGRVRNGGMTYTEAILRICEDRVIDPADFGNMISPAIREKIEAEAIKSRTIKGSENQLPL